jgi:soluble methane monooxygenase-binding protein MmoD
MTLHSVWESLEPPIHATEAAAGDGIELHAEWRLRALGTDLGFGWSWEIFRDGVPVQTGCSLTESSAREAVQHVIAFLRLGLEREAPGQQDES